VKTVTDETSAYGRPPDRDQPPDLADFGLLFETYAPELHRYLARRTGPAADDLVADTFVAALRGRGGYDPRRAPVRAWLYGIATNLANEHTRRGARERAATGRLAVPDRVDSHDDRVADRVDAQTRAEQLSRAIAGLSDGDRDVLLLSSWAELDGNEIAAVLGIAPGTVRSRLHRVRRHLRRLGPTIDLPEGSRHVD
jgi:RNA polymerase sigma-70 factor (ECF subfamily)